MSQKSSGKGLVFQSPVFTNKSIYLQKDPSPGKSILNEPNYSNVTFFDSLIVGDGDIYQKDVSGGISLFKPYNNGGAGSVYHTENTNTFGGFQKGVRQEMFDNGLDCALNQTYPLPPGSPCSLNISAETTRCLNRMMALSDLSKTKQSQLVIYKRDQAATRTF